MILSLRVLFAPGRNDELGFDWFAKGFACGRTKTTQIVKRAVAPDLLDDVVQICRSQPFTIMCDESNDHGNDKCFVILIKVFDDEKSCHHMT
jgi:hypothetical protein